MEGAPMRTGLIKVIAAHSVPQKIVNTTPKKTGLEKKAEDFWCEHHCWECEGWEENLLKLLEEVRDDALAEAHGEY